MRSGPVSGWGRFLCWRCQGRPWGCGNLFSVPPQQAIQGGRGGRTTVIEAVSRVVSNLEIRDDSFLVPEGVGAGVSIVADGFSLA